MGEGGIQGPKSFHRLNSVGIQPSSLHTPFSSPSQTQLAHFLLVFSPIVLFVGNAPSLQVKNLFCSIQFNIHLFPPSQSLEQFSKCAPGGPAPCQGVCEVLFFQLQSCVRSDFSSHISTKATYHNRWMAEVNSKSDIYKICKNVNKPKTFILIKFPVLNMPNHNKTRLR